MRVCVVGSGPAGCYTVQQVGCRPQPHPLPPYRRLTGPAPYRRRVCCGAALVGLRACKGPGVAFPW